MLENKNYSVIALISTLLFHSILFIIFYFINLDAKIENKKEFFEVSLSSVPLAQVERSGKKNVNDFIETKKFEKKENSKNNKEIDLNKSPKDNNNKNKQISQSRNNNIIQRNYFGDEDIYTNNDIKKNIKSHDNDIIKEFNKIDKSENKNFLTDNIGNNKKDKGDKGFLGDNALVGKPEGNKNTSIIIDGINFSISGEAENRAILFKALPKSEEIKYSGKVEIMFIIAPNGSIKNIIPLTKTNPELVNLTLNYFKKWQFAPLPKNSLKKDDEGKIVFIYKLK